MRKHTITPAQEALITYMKNQGIILAIPMLTSEEEEDTLKGNTICTEVVNMKDNEEYIHVNGAYVEKSFFAENILEAKKTYVDKN